MCIKFRYSSDDPHFPAQRAWRVGLGNAIAGFPKLHTLHVDGDDTFNPGTSELPQVIHDLCVAKYTPPVRDLTITHLNGRHEVINLLIKLRATLRNVVFDYITLPPGRWTSPLTSIFAALTVCDLEYLNIHSPMISDGSPITLHGGAQFFRPMERTPEEEEPRYEELVKRTLVPLSDGLKRLCADDVKCESKDFIIEGAEEWSEAKEWLREVDEGC